VDGVVSLRLHERLRERGANGPGYSKSITGMAVSLSANNRTKWPDFERKFDARPQVFAYHYEDHESIMEVVAELMRGRAAADLCQEARRTKKGRGTKL